MPTTLSLSLKMKKVLNSYPPSGQAMLWKRKAEFNQDALQKMQPERTLKNHAWLSGVIFNVIIFQVIFLERHRLFLGENKAECIRV